MTHSDGVVCVALNLAHTAHKGQWRKHSGAPYILHPLEVSKRLGVWGVSKFAHPELWAAALLHDVLEDTSMDLRDIENQCGLEVANLVMEMTFRQRQPGETGDSYRNAKEEYLQSFDNKSIQSLVLKVADRLCNVEDYLKEGTPYVVKYFDKALPLFKAMLGRELEIVQFFGVEVITKMRQDYLCVKASVDKLRG